MAIVQNDGVDGKICNKCGEWKPVSEYSHQRSNLRRGGDGYHYTCKQCYNHMRRLKRLENPEEARAKARAYYQTNSETIIAQSHASRQKHIEKRRAHDREYYREHHEERKSSQRVRNRLRRAADPEGVRAYHREYARASRKANPQKARHQERVSEQRRRNREYNAEGFHTVAEWEALKAYYDHTCLRCRRREPEITLTRDHVVPLSKGGSDWIDNIQPLCFSCNSSKGDRTVDYRPAWEVERSGRYPQAPEDGGSLGERRAPYLVRPYVARLFRQHRRGPTGHPGC